MDFVPISLKKRENGRLIDISWSDGWEQTLAARTLRDCCPCATCREKHAAAKKKATSGVRQLQILSDQELQPLVVAGMTPAGGYAYNIAFSDGHQSGIYTLEFLRQLTIQSDASNPL